MKLEEYASRLDIQLRNLEGAEEIWQACVCDECSAIYTPKSYIYKGYEFKNDTKLCSAGCRNELCFRLKFPEFNSSLFAKFRVTQRRFTRRILPNELRLNKDVNELINKVWCGIV